MLRALLAASAVILIAASPALAKDTPGRPTTAAQINFAGFAALAEELGPYRQGRLVTLAQFQAMARDGNALILDARSADAYARGHIDGAVNLPFTDFTQAALDRAIGDANRPILIYCNNNFSNNAAPVLLKRVELALNIQTFINLYGYGYRNIYELGDVVDFNDPAVGWVRG